MSEDKPADRTLTINYIKSNAFREVACDGALGGPTPNGKLWLAFYTERFPLPRVVRHALSPTDQPDTFMIDGDAPGESLEGREGMIRNVEFGVYMNLQTAEHLHSWLSKHIELLKSRGNV